MADRIMAHTFHLFYVCLYKFSLVLPLLLLKDTNNVQIKSISDYIKTWTKLGFFISFYKLNVTSNFARNFVGLKYCICCDICIQGK